MTNEGIDFDAVREATFRKRRPAKLNKAEINIAKANGIPAKVAHLRYSTHKWSAKSAIHTPYIKDAPAAPKSRTDEIKPPLHEYKGAYWCVTFFNNQWTVMQNTAAFFAAVKQKNPDIELIPVRSRKEVMKLLAERLPAGVLEANLAQFRNTQTNQLPSVTPEEQAEQDAIEAAKPKRTTGRFMAIYLLEGHSVPHTENHTVMEEGILSIVDKISSGPYISGYLIRINKINNKEVFRHTAPEPEEEEE